MFKSINESFEKKFNDINNEDLANRLRECLNRLNESEMSDEDRHDTELIWSMLGKISNRSNARFTPEEEAVLRKYGLKRDNYYKTIKDDAGRPIYDKRVDGKRRSYGYRPFSNGDQTKMNLADRARKRPLRRDNRVTAGHDWVDTPNDVLNQHDGYDRYEDDPTLQTRDREAAEYRAGKPVRDMNRHLRNRARSQSTLATADADLDSKLKSLADERDAEVMGAISRYDSSSAWARRQHKYSVDSATRDLATSQSEIDKMLKRDKKEESPV